MRLPILPTLTVITIVGAALCALWLVIGAGDAPELRPAAAFSVGVAPG